MAVINTIFSNLKTKLATITKENGYATDVNFVGLQPESMEKDIKDVPYIVVMEQPETPLHYGNTNNRYSTAVTLKLFVRDNVDYYTAINNLIDDVKSLVHSGIESNLGANCLKLLYIGIEDMSLSGQQNIGDARLIIEIIWWDAR